MCFNNGNNDCSCLWIILIIILLVCCCGGSWGGNWGGAMGVDESCLPATYEIDYVRVFQKQ